MNQPPHATHGGRDAADGLLIIVDSTGIPVLVRPYGDVQKPPSAAVGIVSAVFHAARMGDTTQLRALRSANRSIAYVLAGEILLSFVQSHRHDETRSVQLSAERMLRALLRALQLSIGPAMPDLESTKLRVAISRHLAIVDYLVTHTTGDVRLSLELPVAKVGPRCRRTTPQSLPSALLYAAWIQDGVIWEEIGLTSDARCGAIDLVIVSLIAELNSTSKYPSATVWIDGPLKIVGLRGTAWHERQFVLGIFSPDATSAHIASFTAFVDGDSYKDGFTQPAEGTTESESLGQWFDLGLKCCFVVPLTVSVTRRAVAIGSPVKEGASGAASRRELWRMLSQFVRASTMSRTLSVQRMDYKQEDEVFTFIHCSRKPFAIYAICRGHMAMTSVVQVGDAIASCVLRMQV